MSAMGNHVTLFMTSSTLTGFKEDFSETAMPAKREQRRSSIKRFFFGRNKHETLSAIDDKQNELVKDVSSLCKCSNDIYCATNNTLETVTRVEKELHEMHEKLEQNLRNELNTSRIKNEKFEKELQILSDEKHSIELHVCRLQSKYEDLQLQTADVATYVKKCDDYESRILKMAELLDESKISAISQNGEFLLKETTIKNEIERMERNEKLLLEELQAVREECQKTNMSRNTLCKLLREKDEKLQAAWVMYSKVIKERDELELKLKCKVQPQMSLEQSVWATVETKLLQKEMTIYRRDKLIEILEDKLIQYDHTFSVQKDLHAYTDDNFNAISHHEDSHPMLQSESNASCSSYSYT